MARIGRLVRIKGRPARRKVLESLYSSEIKALIPAPRNPAVYPKECMIPNGIPLPLPASAIMGIAAMYENVPSAEIAGRRMRSSTNPLTREIRVISTPWKRSPVASRILLSALSAITPAGILTAVLKAPDAETTRP